MTPVLTTITVCWKRPAMLEKWLACVRAATLPQVRHLIYFVNETPPATLLKNPGNIDACVSFQPPDTSISHYHNTGIEFAKSEWVMKLDIDTMPNVRFFSELLGFLPNLAPREWVNVGMLYLSRVASLGYFAPHRLPLTEAVYADVLANRNTVCQSAYRLPAGTNFVCRKSDYLAAGGCDPRYRGYGWEDYHQIYNLEHHFLGRDPLPGPVTSANVTSRCRDEISRLKAVELWKHNEWLCLLHHWHPVDQNTVYRNQENMNRNRQLLLDMILETKREFETHH